LNIFFKERETKLQHDKDHHSPLYTGSTVTTGPSRANIMLVWSSVKMNLTTCYNVAE